MTIASWLLFALGLLGATDIALYHSIAHGIRHNPDSRQELIVHCLRGPTYAALFLVMPNVVLAGAWYWALVGVLVFDLAISLWDFAIEGESRRFLGGLPTGEYVLHILIAMTFGAMCAAVWFEGKELANANTAFRYEPGIIPFWMRGVFAIMAAGVLISGIMDIGAAIRMRGMPKRGTDQDRINT